MKKRKRKPGGGRKPQGEFGKLTAVMSLRMPEDVHDKLVLATRVSGRSLSQELIARVNASLEDKRAQLRDPALRAFSFLFAELAEVICVDIELRPDWRFDPWLFQTFKLALPKLLDRFQPTGKAELPWPWDTFREIEEEIEGHPHFATKEARKQIMKSPEAMADYAVQIVLSNFSDPRRFKDLYKRRKAAAEQTTDPFSWWMHYKQAKAWETTYYGMTDAQRDLAPKQKSLEGNS